MSPGPPRLEIPTAPADMLRYAVASGDLHALHHDPGSPEAIEAGGCLVPGRYLLGVIARLIHEALPEVALRELDCAWLAPARVGEPLWLELRRRGDRLRVRVLREGGVVAAGHAQIG